VSEDNVMFPFWMHIEMTTWLQILTGMVAATSWLLLMLTGHRCGV